MIRIGSRGSALARWQAEHVADLLRAKGRQVSIEIIVTTGDRVQDPFLQVGVKGMFAKEIEEALAAGRIDLAVHSLKDLPAKLAEEFTIACVPERADARDAFVSEKLNDFAALPSHARVGAGSLRRQAQLRALRPDLELLPLRGNVDTRLRKLHEGQYDAIVLAAAGLDRLGRTEWLRERFSSEKMCPAVGQGALAVECRADDDTTKAQLAAFDHRPSRLAVTAERAALATLDGGCQVPVGIYCSLEEDGWQLTAIAAEPDGSRILRERLHIDRTEDRLERFQNAGEALGRRLLEAGARDLLADRTQPQPAVDSAERSARA